MMGATFGVARGVARVATLSAVLVAAVAFAPTHAEAQRVQPALLRELSVASLGHQLSDTTPARRTPLLQRLRPAHKIGLAGLVVAGTTLIVANNARARQPVRSGFAVDQRSLVVAGAIVGATVTAIWIERRKREDRDAR